MPTVLIGEDDADTLEMMEYIMGAHGYGTMTATNGKVALERMRERRPCVVLLDLTMPVMDGWEFRRRQRPRALQRAGGCGDRARRGDVPVAVEN